MIKIELDIDGYHEFLDNLNYQICKLYSFYKKIPEFNKQLDKLELEINSKEASLKEMQRHFDEIRIREVYKTVVREYEDLLRKHNFLS